MFFKNISIIYNNFKYFYIFINLLINKIIKNVKFNENISYLIQIIFKIKIINFVLFVNLISLSKSLEQDQKVLI